MRSRRRYQLAAAAIAVALLAAACGDDGGGTTSAATTTAPASGTSGASTTAAPTTAANVTPSRGVTATSIKVGGMGYKLGFGGGDVGAQARFARENAAGGVNGRKIEYTGFEDDGGDQTKNLDAAKKLVEQDGVFAILPATSTASVGSPAYLKDQKTPFFGWAISPTWCNNDWAFGYNGCLQPGQDKITGDGYGPMLKNVLGGQSAAGKTLAVIAEDSASGKAGIGSVTESMVNAGFKVVFGKSSVPAKPVTTSDWSPYVNEIKASNGGNWPDAVYSLVFLTDQVAFAKALRDAGYKGLYFNAVLYDARFLAPQAGLDITTILQFEPTESTPQSAAMKQMLDDIKAFKADQAITPYVIQGYLVADMFINILKKVGAGLNADMFVKAANDNFTWKLDGIAGQVTYPAQHSIMNACYSAVTTKDGKSFTTLSPLACGTVKLK